MARDIAAELRGLGFQRVRQEGTIIRHSGGPWISLGWNPLTLVSAGRIEVFSSPDGFILQYRLGLGRLILALTSGVIVGTVVAHRWGSSGPWLPIATFLGLSAAFILWQALVLAPRRLLRAISASLD